MKIKSWDFKTHRDCFGNKGPTTVDHIFPKSKGGIRSRRNSQLLSKKSNLRKADKLEGKINKIPFRIVKQLDKNQKVQGLMRIQIDEEWYDVERVLLD